MTADEYPPLTFSTGVNVDGLDMAEWVSHAYFDLCKARFALLCCGWEEQSAKARSLGHELLELLETMRDKAEKEGEE